MRVCAEFEDQTKALEAHRHLVDQGVEADDIEIRSPYPLPEAPIPPHRSRPTVMRNVVRLSWVLGTIGGFAFLAWTQLEWGTGVTTGGSPLISIPLDCIPMYEIGLLTALWVTTFMFFIETRPFRKLVPPLEEDLPVANGFIALVISGESAKKAKAWLEGHGARSIVTYALPVMVLALLLNGCAISNMRQQDVIKPTQAAAVPPPPRSLRMPFRDELAVRPPQPPGYLEYGDPIKYQQLKTEMNAQDEKIEDNPKLSGPQIRQQQEAVQKKLGPQIAKVEPELMALKDLGSPPAALHNLKNPVPPTRKAVEQGQMLYGVNCAACHGPKGKGNGMVGELTYVAPPAIGEANYLTQFTDGDFYYWIMVGKNKMPPFGYKMDTKQIFELVDFLRHLEQEDKAGQAH